MKRITERPVLFFFGKLFIGLVLCALIVAWPVVIISVLVVGLGTYILVDGIFSLVNAIKKRHTESNWDWLFLNGMFGIFAGVLTFFNPFIIVAAATFVLLSK